MSETSTVSKHLDNQIRQLVCWCIEPSQPLGGYIRAEKGLGKPVDVYRYISTNDIELFAFVSVLKFGISGQDLIKCLLLDYSEPAAGQFWQRQS